MKSELTLKGGAGYYTGTVAGLKVEVEYVETAYGDKGWNAWVAGQQVTDFPRPTRKGALAVALQTVAQESK